MAFLIDTNIISELQKGSKADVGVKSWYDKCNPDELYLSVLVVGEIRQGIERLRRRDPIQAERLESRLIEVQSMMQGRILPITENIAQRWAVAELDALNRPRVAGPFRIADAARY